MVEFNQKLIEFYRILTLTFNRNPIFVAKINRTEFDIQIWNAWNPNRRQFDSGILVALAYSRP